MTGDELRGRLRQLGLRYNKAAPLLGLSTPGLHHQLRGERSVSRRTERLLQQLEERSRPVISITGDSTTNVFRRRIDEKAARSSDLPRVDPADLMIALSPRRTVTADPPADATSHPFGPWPTQPAKTITAIDVEAMTLRGAVKAVDDLIYRYRADRTIGPKVHQMMRPLRVWLQARLDGAETILLERERESRTGKPELKVIAADPPGAEGEGEPDGEGGGPEEPGSED